MISASRLSRVLAGAALASALSISAAAAAAATAAAAQASADYYLKIDGVDGEATKKGGSSSGLKGEIEILSWSWGASNSGSAHAGGGMGAGKVQVQDIVIPRHGARAPAAVSHDLRTNVVARTAPPGVAASDLDAASLKRGVVTATSPGTTGIRVATGAIATGGTPGTTEIGAAAGDLDGDGLAEVAGPRDAASGLPTGKRQHKPMTFSKPLETGSVTLVGRFGGCAVGTRYPGLELGGRGGPTYRLQDAVVIGCAVTSSSGARPAETVSLNYAKVTVRGWDPATKKE